MRLNKLNFISGALLYVFLFLSSQFVSAQRFKWTYDTGSFVNNGNKTWTNFNFSSNISYTFIENQVAENSIELYREGYGYIRIEFEECFYAAPGSTYSKLYTGSWNPEYANRILQNKQLEIEKQRLEMEREKNARQERIEKEKEIKQQEEQVIKAKQDEKKRIENENIASKGANFRMRNGVMGDNIEMVQKAIKEDANVSVIFEEGQNILFYVKKNTRIAELLIQNGADINIVRSDGCTPLHIAQTPEVASIYIKYGANINAKTVENKGALIKAIEDERFGVAKLLINEGLKEEGAMTLASEKNNLELIKLFFSKKVKEPEALTVAIKNDNLEIFKFLIDVGMKTNQTMYEACEKNRTEMVKTLIAKRETPSYVDLYLVAVNGNYELTELLLNNGADVKKFKKEYGFKKIRDERIKELIKSRD